MYAQRKFIGKSWQTNKKLDELPNYSSFGQGVYLKQVATGGTTSATNTPGIYGKIVDAHDLRVEAAFLSN